jgi:hypothetical protein
LQGAAPKVPQKQQGSKGVLRILIFCFIASLFVIGSNYKQGCSVLKSRIKLTFLIFRTKDIILAIRKN